MDQRLSAARAPEGFRRVRSWPLARIDELTALRDELGATLPVRPGGGLEDVPESVVLVASELATNAISHGGSSATVHLSSRPGEVLLDVVDRAPDRAPALVSGRPRGQGGFGLVLAARLADELGWYCTPDAKHVWARFEVRTEAPRLTA